jgi:4-amino-4-deoxy-L-arabinose transferase-like glycosyltransferase
MKKLSFVVPLITIVIVVNILRAVLPLHEKYVRTDYWERYPALKKMYYDSVYANKKGDFIRDEYVYSFAAGAYLNGVSPVLVNPETPPLGKYFIGLSIVLFRNEHLLTLFFGIGSLILLYFLGKQIFSSTLLALLPVLLLTFEPLFLNQLRITPLLDIMQLFFLLAFFLLFNKAAEGKKPLQYFLLANIMVGAFISVKFFGTGITLLGAATALLLLRKHLQTLIQYVLTTAIAPVILLSMYVPVLLTGYSLREFLGIQKWILLYNQGHAANFFHFFPLFLFNIWYSWWDTSIMSDFQWQVTWPLSFVFLLIIGIIYFRLPKYRNKQLDIVLMWAVLYILILQTGYMSSRYFVILLPALFLIMIYGMKVLVELVMVRKK